MPAPVMQTNREDQSNKSFSQKDFEKISQWRKDSEDTVERLNYDFFNKFYPQTRELIKGGVGWLLGVSTGTLLWALGYNKNYINNYVFLILIVSVVCFYIIQSLLYYKQYCIARLSEDLILTNYNAKIQIDQIFSAMELGYNAANARDLNGIKDSVDRVSTHQKIVDSSLIEISNLEKDVREEMSKCKTFIFSDKLKYLFLIGLLTYILGIFLLSFYVIFSNQTGIMEWLKI
jgi:hypothetical protein